MPSPTPPPDEGGMGGVSEGVIPYALMHFHPSKAGGENTKHRNIISLSKGGELIDKPSNTTILACYK